MEYIKNTIQKQKKLIINSKKINSNINSNTKKINSNDFKFFNLLVGEFDNQKIYVPESGLYQNFLITGTIGSR